MSKDSGEAEPCYNEVSSLFWTAVQAPCRAMGRLQKISEKIVSDLTDNAVAVSHLKPQLDEAEALEFERLDRH